MRYSSDENSAVGDLAEETQDGFLLPVYHDTLGPALEGETQMLGLLTVVGIGLVIWQMVTLILEFRKHQTKKQMVFMLVGGILLSSMLIFPTVMIPIYLTVIDTVIAFLVSLASGATGDG